MPVISGRPELLDPLAGPCDADCLALTGGFFFPKFLNSLAETTGESGASSSSPSRKIFVSLPSKREISKSIWTHLIISVECRKVMS